MPVISVRNIAKSYGAIRALHGVSFDIQPGEIVGLLGPNGAGKSTAIKVITGFLHPDEGSVEIDGKNVLTDLQAVQAKLGYLSENTPLYPELSVQAYLAMMAELRGITTNDFIPLLSDAVYGAGLEDYLTRPIASLSKGLRQRVGLAQAILHKPPFLILDEPTRWLGSDADRRDPRPDQVAGAGRAPSSFHRISCPKSRRSVTA